MKYMCEMHKGYNPNPTDLFMGGQFYQKKKSFNNNIYGGYTR